MSPSAPAAVLPALGLMSGTSMDGIDLAMIDTDGERVAASGPAGSGAYSPETRRRLQDAIEAGAAMPHGQGITPAVRAVWDRAEAAVTQDHGAAIAAFAAEHPAAFERLSVIGYHGQTVLHRPKEGITVQLGDGAALARRFSKRVVGAFRVEDVAAGGEGAPFAPLYHRALAATWRQTSKAEGPVAVLNLGGVGNVTWIGADDEAILAFDTGPANGPIDDWVREMTGAAMDADGALARSGTVDETVLEALSGHCYFSVTPPKSLDRLDFGIEAVRGLTAADGAATLTAFTARSVALARAHFPAPACIWIVCGGGRHNPCLMDALQECLDAPVISAEKAGWRGDEIEAEAFAFLAVRSLRGLPLSVPSTTGVPHPCLGGRLFEG